MITQAELDDRLSTLHRERKTGRVYVYVQDNTDGISVIWLTLKQGEIINIVDKRKKDGAATSDFRNLPVRSITFIPSSIPDKISKTPGAAGGKATVDKSPTCQLLTLSRNIDRIIATKRLDIAMTRGKIGLLAGVPMNFDESTPDDVSKINRIKVAAREILGEDL